MRHKRVLLMVLVTPLFLSWSSLKNKWMAEKQNDYTLFYTPSEKQNIGEYKAYFEAGKKTVEDFFQQSFKNAFGIYIHPTRSSLDSAWQKDWNMPEFKSQCWMVASGVYDKLDIISPKSWDSLACEHSYTDSIETLRLVTHELVHVYHGQQNKSPDFNEVTGINWFIEGLAVYGSGQCDSIRISDVKKALSENKIPATLNKFWSGNLRYGLSGTVVMYLDQKYGRERLIRLLPHNHLEELLAELETTELEIINEWRKYMEHR